MTLLDGVPGTNVSYRSFNAASLPTESLPGYEQYKLIATGYFLAPEERIVSKVNFTLSYDGHNIGENFDNVPIQRNYRTNIIGDFFTEGANYTIVIVTHSMQQAARVSQRTAMFHLGHLVEENDTDKMFTNPDDQRTQDYIMGRFG